MSISTLSFKKSAIESSENLKKSPVNLKFYYIYYQSRATATHLNLQSQKICSSQVDRIDF